MSDARNDFCGRCGFSRPIAHSGNVPRKAPFKGSVEVKYCGPCYETIKRGGDVAAVIFDTPQASSSIGALDPASEVYLIKFRAKVQWFATGLLVGIGVGFAFFSLLVIRGGL